MNLGKNNIIKIAIIVINVIFCVILPISLLFALFSPMMFDAPGAVESIVLWITFIASATAPIVILISVVTSFILLFKVKSYKIALLFSLLPLVNVAVILITMWYVQVFQNGNLVM